MTQSPVREVPESRVIHLAKNVLGCVKHEKGKFHIRQNQSEILKDGAIEIPQDTLLSALVDLIDQTWQFPTKPEPRVTGSLLELLRGCRFFTDNQDKGHILILPDRRLSKYSGAFDTPQPIIQYLVRQTLSPLCTNKNLPIVVDLSCGAGYFILSAFDHLRDFYREVSHATILNSLCGLDTNESAIKLSRRNLKWHLMHTHKIHAADSDLEHVFKLADALSDFSIMPIQAGEIDAVIGNPPYQFVSGKGSIAAALERDGKYEEAAKYRERTREYCSRFPLSSKGCRDMYKWFINRAVECLKPGGFMGFITPNTWITYPHYQDIRDLLHHEGQIIEIIDFGSNPFKQAHVPTSTLIWQKGSHKSFCYRHAKISKEQWRSVISSREKTIVDVIKDAISVKTSLSRGSQQRLQVPHWKKLGEIAILREGSHAISTVPIDVPRIPSSDADFPVVIDKTLKLWTPPETGYILKPDRLSNKDFHSGERFFIRKTEDRIIIAPSLTTEFALAHQNVYVGKLKSNAISFHALLGILSSPLLTRIYRQGPGGQQGRPLAQLRITFLYDLPIVIQPESWHNCAPDHSGLPTGYDYLSNMDKLWKMIENIEPIPLEFPSNESGRNMICKNIALIHSILEIISRQIIESRDPELIKISNYLVNKLYGIAAE